MSRVADACESSGCGVGGASLFARTARMALTRFSIISRGTWQRSGRKRLNTV